MANYPSKRVGGQRGKPRMGSHGGQYGGHRGAVIRLHILAAEKALGHKLPKGAIVHHVDGDETNYQNHNLVILQSQADHLELHRKMRVRAAGGDPWTERLCATCNAPQAFSAFTQSHPTMCKTCKRAYNRNDYQTNHRYERIT